MNNSVYYSIMFAGGNKPCEHVQNVGSKKMKMNSVKGVITVSHALFCMCENSIKRILKYERVTRETIIIATRSFSVNKLGIITKMIQTAKSGTMNEMLGGRVRIRKVLSILSRNQQDVLVMLDKQPVSAALTGNLNDSNTSISLFSPALIAARSLLITALASTVSTIQKAMRWVTCNPVAGIATSFEVIA